MRSLLIALLKLPMTDNFDYYDKQLINFLYIKNTAVVLHRCVFKWKIVIFVFFKGLCSP